ncbi:leucyl aminopeptidase family protein [Georgenia muralis]
MIQPVLPEIVVLDESLADPAASWRGLGAEVLGVVRDTSGTVDDAADLYGVDLTRDADSLEGNGGASAVVTLPHLRGGAAPWEGLPGRVVLLGEGDGGPDDARRAGLALGRAATGRDTVVLVLPPGAREDRLQALAEGFLLASFRMPRTAREPDGKPPARRLVMLSRGGPTADALARARTAVEATLLTRALAATPSSTKNPGWLADQVLGLTAAVSAEIPASAGTLSAEVRDEDWLERHGFGAILAVGAASATPPRLVTLTWEPAAADAPVVALVGKGITFDTGGISIKPREAMVPMKTDMAGAAAVLAAVLGAARLTLPVRTTAVLPLAENAIGGAAYRPGDVVRTYDGTTVEISNTDAEGRMVLADALAWAVEQLAPDVVVDVATLTGAASQGLGRSHAALYATDDDLAADVLAAGGRAGEPAWRMPLVADYRPALDSDVADVAHAVRDPHVGGGSITAALFLQRFVADVPWAHLDIAGAGRAGSKQGEVPANGPTGYGSRLLVEYLRAVGSAAHGDEKPVPAR